MSLLVPPPHLEVSLLVPPPVDLASAAALLLLEDLDGQPPLLVTDRQCQVGQACRRTHSNGLLHQNGLGF